MNRLGNNLPMHIRENTDFPRQRPRQLQSAEAHFEGCYMYDRMYKYLKLFLNGNVVSNKVIANRIVS